MKIHWFLIKVQKKAQKKYISKANIDLYIFFIVHSQCFKTQKKRRRRRGNIQYGVLNCFSPWLLITSRLFLLYCMPVCLSCVCVCLFVLLISSIVISFREMISYIFFKCIKNQLYMIQYNINYIPGPPFPNIFGSPNSE